MIAWLRGCINRWAYPCRHSASGFRVSHTYCPGRDNCTYCPYCTKPLPAEPVLCCGEMGHAVTEARLDD